MHIGERMLAVVHNRELPLDHPLRSRFEPAIPMFLPSAGLRFSPTIILIPRRKL